jgi:hypothetical protein
MRIDNLSQWWYKENKKIRERKVMRKVVVPIVIPLLSAYLTGISYAV